MVLQGSKPLLVPILRRKGKYLGTPLPPVFRSPRSAVLRGAVRYGLAIVGCRARNPTDSPNASIRFSGSVSSHSDTGQVEIH